jgi:hypothetical protein
MNSRLGIYEKSKFKMWDASWEPPSDTQQPTRDLKGLKVVTLQILFAFISYFLYQHLKPFD